MAGIMPVLSAEKLDKEDLDFINSGKNGCVLVLYSKIEDGAKVAEHYADIIIKENIAQFICPLCGKVHVREGKGW